MSEQRQVVTADGAPAAVGPYSHAVAHGGLLFCSGQVPLDPASGTLVEGTLQEQTARCLENLAVVCAAGGTSLERAVRCGIYVTDIATFKDVNEAYAAFFADAPPARTLIGVASLPLGAQVEIDAMVALP
ncbi:MAG: RidA family protein [Solirubrobacterales bacterium]|jgi:2-iminobutanoate/2-iminopropanoate deaminase|nr:RidA family protein [Solirubrobacterales bacterium]